MVADLGPVDLLRASLAGSHVGDFGSSGFA